MSKNKIKKSIDNIEPQVDAKERMYQNILKKAQKTAPTEKPAETKKKNHFLRFALPIAACLCFAVLGITGFIPDSTQTQPNAGYVEGGNPFVDVENADAFKEIGITFDAPSDASDISYTIINGEIASIHFMINGKSFEARASTQDGDFSGLTGEKQEIKIIDKENNATLYKIGGDIENVYKITWSDDNVSYCLYGTDGAVEDEVIDVYNAFDH